MKRIRERKRKKRTSWWLDMNRMGWDWMRDVKCFGICFLLSVFMVTVTQAQTLKKSVIGSAGGTITTSELTLHATAGQPSVGIVSGAISIAKIGFWFEDIAETSTEVALVLTNSFGQPIVDQRVDLLRANGSNTGTRQNTDESGQVVFSVDPENQYKLKVYHNGGSFVTDLINVGQQANVQTALSTLTLINSGSQPIGDQRVDLLRSNNSNTGVRLDTDGSGQASFEILPDYTHKFKVYHNGGAYVTDDATYGDDISVQTQLSVLTLLDSGSQPIDEQRVDLLRANNSNTGVRFNTESGQASFEVLPDYTHKFKVYHNGGSYITDEATYGDDLTVQTVLSTLTLINSGSEPIGEQRVDLLRSNNSNTGVRLDTDGSGQASFEILPDYTHKFKVYHNGGSYMTADVGYNENVTVQTAFSTLTLTSSMNTPIAETRVDLLRSNNSNTGVRTETNGDGIAGFEILPDYVHKFKVYYNGQSYVTDDVPWDGDMALEIEVETPVVVLYLKDSAGQAVVGQRVDLLRSNNSNTGVRLDTDVSGRVSFDVVPEATHKFKVYHNGGSYVTVEVPTGDSTTVQTASSTFTLTNSAGEAIVGQRVDLLRSNNSNTGVRFNTDGDGQASFEILPDYAHKFKVYHNGGSYVTDAVTYGEGMGVQTGLSTFVLVNSATQGIGEQRVDLLRSNNSNTGIRENTVETTGIATFEVLPNYEHKFKVYHNGGSYVTEAVAFDPNGETAPVTQVQTLISTLTLQTSAGVAIGEQRVDLLRSNDSNTGVRVNTNETTGVASFEVLPDYVHKFKVYHNGLSYVTDEMGDEEDVVVATRASTLTLTNSASEAIAGQRVDLLRSNNSNTGVRVNTDETTGVAAFEVLPNAAHKFKVYFNGGSLVTEDVIAIAADASHDEAVQTEARVLTLLNDGALVMGTRVDLLRGNDSNTGIREDTDDNGVVAFEVLPGFEHKLKTYVFSEASVTDLLIGGGETTFDVNPSLGKPTANGLAFGLEQNRPNPFNPSTSIRYTLNEASDVYLVIYNQLGQEVRRLLDVHQAAGKYSVQWDGRDALGRQVATGVYISRLIADENVATMKMTFAK